jgi:transposase
MSTRKTTQYPMEFKKSSAKLAVSNAQSIRRTAEELGVNVMTLHGWIKKYTPQTKETKSTLIDKDLLDENRRLKKENAKLLEERDILKKATAYFAKEIL